MKWPRRIIVGVVGGTILLVGLALVVLPGPALVVIPLGLSILGAEFVWARRWLRKLEHGVHNGLKFWGLERLWRRFFGPGAKPVQSKQPLTPSDRQTDCPAGNCHQD